MSNILERYANLLVNYCVEIKNGEKLFIRTTTLAEPLVREVYRAAIKAGAIVEVEMAFREQNRILINEGKKHQLESPSLVYQKAMEEFDAYIFIRAPFNLRENQNINSENSAIRSEALKPLSQTYFKRTATRDLKRNLCQYPTQAAAQNAGMSLEEYEKFVYNACKLYDVNPIQSWLNVRKHQQQIVDVLNGREQIRYRNANFDITFSTKNRIWINSDGQTNMPSGEVYTSPVEDSVNGTIHFDFPGVYMGHEVENVTLWVEQGLIYKWEAERGQAFLDSIFEIPGTRRFGEAAIGTNFNIDRLTKNILFDEKIGGSVHMAIGQSYLQCGGKNESSIHWDMIAGMTRGGEIYADDEKIYENGEFLFI